MIYYISSMFLILVLADSGKLASAFTCEFTTLAICSPLIFIMPWSSTVSSTKSTTSSTTSTRSSPFSEKQK